MGKKEKSHNRYFKEVIYDGKNIQISTERKPANISMLLQVLGNKSMKRKDIMKLTNWTRGQVAGLLYRGKNKGVIRLNGGIVTAIK